jgi:DNA polymerase
MTLLKPKLILAVGRIAAHFLLGTNVSLGRLRGMLHYYGEAKIPLIVTFHPAYLLRSPQEKSKAYEDLLKVKKMLGSVDNSTMLDITS